MDFDHEEILEPVSPSSQYLRSSALSLTILAVMESEIPIDDSMTFPLLKDVFLAINPRFSSIMITEKNGGKKWKQVQVNLEDHVNVPIFPEGKSPDFYDEYLTNYISKIAMEELPHDRPLWELHIIKYPTSNAAGNIIFKLHHALGDGYSLMGALLSCLQRLDNPSLPLTFPSRQSKTKYDREIYSTLSIVPRFFSRVFNTIYDFGFSVLMSTVMEDDCSPIRSGIGGVEYLPITVTSTAFNLDQIKQIKTKLKVTINDVITGVIIYGTRLYMQRMDDKSSEANSTAMVLLNTRAIGGYKSVSEMVKPNAEMPWGNHFAFLPITLTKLTADNSLDPLSFVLEAHRTIKRKKNSASVYLVGKLLDTIRKIRGPESGTQSTAQYIQRTLKNSSMAITNVIGPVEKMALANHPIKGIYFVVAGSPQNVECTIVSYVGELRISFAIQKNFIDACKFKTCIENAFETIFKAAVQPSSQREFH